MDKEQIKKALECCTFNPKCEECPICGEDCIKLDQHALSLINELTEDLHASCTEFERKCASLNDENERLTSNLVEKSAENIILSRRIGFDIGAIRADTVRKMQSEIKERCIKGGIYPAFVASTIDQIAKEVLEDVK